MKYFVIGDKDTVLGFSYASVSGRAAETRNDVLAALDEAQKNREVGVVIITEELAAKARDEVNALRRSQMRPLIVEVPGPKGPSAGRRSLLNVISDAVGIRV